MKRLLMMCGACFVIGGPWAMTSDGWSGDTECVVVDTGTQESTEECSCGDGHRPKADGTGCEDDPSYCGPEEYLGTQNDFNNHVCQICGENKVRRAGANTNTPDDCVCEDGYTESEGTCSPICTGENQMFMGGGGFPCACEEGFVDLFEEAGSPLSDEIFCVTPCGEDERYIDGTPEDYCAACPENETRNAASPTECMCKDGYLPVGPASSCIKELDIVDCHENTVLDRTLTRCVECPLYEIRDTDTSCKCPTENGFSVSPDGGGCECLSPFVVKGNMCECPDSYFNDPENERCEPFKEVGDCLPNERLNRSSNLCVSCGAGATQGPGGETCVCISQYADLGEALGLPPEMRPFCVRECEGNTIHDLENPGTCVPCTGNEEATDDKMECECMDPNIEIGNECQIPISCTEPMTPNAQNQCECPVGENVVEIVREGEERVCEVRRTDAECTGTETVNAETNRCECQDPNVEIGGVCEVRATCGAPLTRNVLTNRCECRAPNVEIGGVCEVRRTDAECTGAATVNAETNRCECQDPNVEIGGVCEVRATCGAPLTRNALTNRCECRAPNVEIGGVCEVRRTDAECTAPQTVNAETNRCECQDPNVEIGGVCEVPRTDAECAAPQTVNSLTNRCACQDPNIVINGVCEAPASCETPMVRNASTNRCVCPPNPDGSTDENCNLITEDTPVSELPQYRRFLRAVPESITAQVAADIPAEYYQTVQNALDGCPEGHTEFGRVCCPDEVFVSARGVTDRVPTETFSAGGAIFCQAPRDCEPDESLSPSNACIRECPTGEYSIDGDCLDICPADMFRYDDDECRCPEGQIRFDSDTEGEADDFCEEEVLCEGGITNGLNECDCPPGEEDFHGRCQIPLVSCVEGTVTDENICECDNPEHVYAGGECIPRQKDYEMLAIEGRQQADGVILTDNSCICRAGDGLVEGSFVQDNPCGEFTDTRCGDCPAGQNILEFARYSCAKASAEADFYQSDHEVHISEDQGAKAIGLGEQACICASNGIVIEGILEDMKPRSLSDRPNATYELKVRAYKGE